MLADINANIQTYTAFGIAVGLIVALLRMRREEIRDMGDRIAALESDNQACQLNNRVLLIIQQRLLHVIRVNGLSIPEGTFDATEVMASAQAQNVDRDRPTARRRSRRARD